MPDAPSPSRASPGGVLHTQTPTSLRALLHEVVDYAGLFPPAALPLDEAIRSYARYRRSEAAWMLARFVHPVRQLDALAAHGHLFTQRPPFRFSVLGTGGEDSSAFLEALENDLEALQAFHTRHRDQVLADVMEVRLPTRLLTDEAAEIHRFLDAVHRRLVVSGIAQLDLFYEVPLTDETRQAVPAVAAALAEHNDRQPVPLRAEAGLKLRCGGLEPGYAPAPAHLAGAIVACRSAGTRFKATAGLHHPVRHYNEEAGVTMHGFFNVFGGAALAYAHDLDAEALASILRDEAAKHFQFAEDAFSWNGLSASLHDIQRTRRALAVSFGSCSFEEPRDDLRALGLL